GFTVATELVGLQHDGFFDVYAHGLHGWEVGVIDREGEINWFWQGCFTTFDDLAGADLSHVVVFTGLAFDGDERAGLGRGAASFVNEDAFGCGGVAVVLFFLLLDVEAVLRTGVIREVTGDDPLDGDRIAAHIGALALALDFRDQREVSLADLTRLGWGRIGGAGSDGSGSVGSGSGSLPSSSPVKTALAVPGVFRASNSPRGASAARSWSKPAPLKALGTQFSDASWIRLAPPRVPV